MNNIARNYFYNVSYQILTLITPFITTPYLARVLGADGIGIYSYTSSVVAYFTLLAQFGLTNYAQREVAYYQQDVKRRSCVFFESQILRIILVILSLFIYGYFVYQYENSKIIYWVQSLNIIVVFFDISWFFQGLEEFGKIVFRNFVIRLLNIILIFLLIKQADDLLLYVGLVGGMNLLAGIFIWGYLPRYLILVPRYSLHPFRNFRIIFEMFLPQIAITIYLVMDKTMLGIMTGSLYENGWYEQAEKMAKMPLTIITSLGVVMLPRIASSFAQHDMKKIQDYMLKSARFVWALSIPMCFGMIGIAANFVPWFFGCGYEKVIPLMQIMSGVVIMIGFSNLLGIQYMIPTKRQNQFTLSVLIGAAVNVSLNLILIPYWQSVGAAIATLCAECAVTMTAGLLLKSELPIGGFMRLSIRYLWAGSIMLVVMLIMEQAFEATFLNTLLIIIVGSGVYISILVWKSDEIIISVWKKMCRCLLSK